MKYINDFAYGNYIPQPKQLAKDKKQKNKYRQTQLLESNQNTDDLPVSLSEELLDAVNTIIEEDDRRNGNERRKGQQERGRYVESRLKKNRRYKPELSLIV